MGKKRNLNILVVLLVCFLFIATNTFAISNIATINAYGNNKIEGIISNNDQVEFIVTANIDGDSDLNGNLILGEPIDQTRVIQIGTFTCKTETTGTLCNLKYPTDKPMQFNQKEKKFRILLLNDAKDILDKKDISLIVDNTPPIIKEFVISNTKDFQGKKFSSDGKVFLNFKADEQGYNGDTGSCSGFKAVEFYFGLDKIAECKDTCLGMNNCILPTTTKEYSHQGTGEVKICAKAIDKLDKVSVEKCGTFFVDKEPPKILKETKKLTDLSGNPIKNIATGKSVKVKFSVDIDGLDIDDSSIIADLSELADGLKAKAPTQTIINKENNAIRTYVWEFELNIKSEGTKKVSLSVSDVFGNKLQIPEVIELSLSKDDDGPVVKLITSAKFFGNVYYATSEETFIVEIEDATGINQNDIILHINSQGFKASECKGDKLFTCKFPINLQGFSEGEVSAFIDTDSKDILGNAVKEKKESKFIVDKTQPILQKDDSNQEMIYIFKANAVSEEDAELIKFDDKVVISIFVLDKNSVSATGDLTSIIRNAVNVDIPCKKADEVSILKTPDSWICEVETNAIDITGKKRQIKIILEDKAGNKNEFFAEFDVFPTEEKSEEKFFSLNAQTDDIQHIDYSILTTMARETYPLIIPFDLRENDNCKGTPEIFNARLKCDELKGSLRNLVKKEEIYEGYVQFEITPDIVGNKEQLSIGETNSCIIEYTTKCGDVVYKTPEQQNLRVNIYVNREGISAEDAVVREIEEIKEKVNNNLLKTINFLDKTFTFAQNVCSTKQGFVVAINAINIMGNILAGCKDSAVLDVLSTGACSQGEPALAKLHGVSQKVVDKLSANWIDVMCGYASCTSSKADVPTGVPKPSGNSKLSVGYLTGQYCDKLKDELIKSDSDLARFSRLGAKSKTVYSVFAKAGTQSTLELAKKNWIVAGTCGCIPGLLANLQKYRQIECDKAVCLRDVVPIGARTVNDCNREHGINQCTYITGGIFGVGIDVLTAPFKEIVSTLSHPIASVYVIIRQGAVKGCEGTCPQGGCVLKWNGHCRVAGTMLALEHLAQFTDVLYSLDDFKKASVQPDYCEILNKDDTKQKTHQESSSSQDTTQRLSLPPSQNQPTNPLSPQ